MNARQELRAAGCTCVLYQQDGTGPWFALSHGHWCPLHNPDPDADEPATRRVCAHADTDGEGMHLLEPGETCPRLTAQDGAS